MAGIRDAEIVRLSIALREAEEEENRLATIGLEAMELAVPQVRSADGSFDVEAYLEALRANPHQQSDAFRQASLRAAQLREQWETAVDSRRIRF